MGSENYCGEGFRSEIGKKTESESQIETEIFLRIRSKEQGGSSSTWYLLYNLMWTLKQEQEWITRITASFALVSKLKDNVFFNQIL